MSGDAQPVPRVLLIEDSDSCARLTELTLDEDFAGAVDVSRVPSLTQALTVLAGGAGPDVIVTDLGLPDATGVEIVTRLRAAASPPVVVLSGLETPGMAAALAAAGAAGHVVKGHEQQALAAAITAAMTSGSAADPA